MIIIIIFIIIIIITITKYKTKKKTVGLVYTSVICTKLNILIYFDKSGHYNIEIKIHIMNTFSRI